MNEQIKTYIDNYPADIADMFTTLHSLILDSVTAQVEEKLWAKLPSFCIGEKVVRLIPFKDHINIEAAAIIQHKSELSCYKLTPKGMLQIYVGQALPCDLLKQIFAETLEG